MFGIFYHLSPYIDIFYNKHWQNVDKKLTCFGLPTPSSCQRSLWTPSKGLWYGAGHNYVSGGGRACFLFSLRKRVKKPCLHKLNITSNIYTFFWSTYVFTRYFYLFEKPYNATIKIVWTYCVGTIQNQMYLCMLVVSLTTFWSWLFWFYLIGLIFFRDWLKEIVWEGYNKQLVR